MSKIDERLDKLKEFIQTDDYLYSRGLSNEVNFGLFCYHNDEEMAVRHFIKMVLSDKTMRCDIYHFDLYDVMLDICKQKKILDRIPAMENSRGREIIQKNLNNICSPENFVNAIYNQYSNHQSRDILMISGVGKVFPFLRAHSLMEAMQTRFNDIPVLVMYPGNYDGHYLRLFNRVEPEGHYRSFNLIDF